MAREEQPVYPVFLTNLDRIQVVVVGGGRVATRKVSGLLAVQATRIHVISPALTAQLQAWWEDGRITWATRIYKDGDLAGAGLAFAATDTRPVNAAVSVEAEKRGVLCNVADAPDEGSFHVPAVHRSDGIVVAVGSGGVDPARSKRMRTQIAQWLEASTEDDEADVATHSK